MSDKPSLTKDISLKDFRDFYWYKEDLVNFCREEGIPKNGGKIELEARIEQYLATGNKNVKQKPRFRSVSTFDWNTELLTVDTVITDNYKNTENVREFFTKQLGKQFKFNVKFMNWMKTSTGKSLGTAIQTWNDIAKNKRTNKSPKDIAPQFEYNTYIRDFLKDNPTYSKDQAIKCWKIRRDTRGHNKYRKSDTSFLD